MESEVQYHIQQGLSNSPYLEMNPSSFLLMKHTFFKVNFILPSHLHLGFPKGLLLVGLPVKTWNARLPSSIQATCPTHFNLSKLCKCIYKVGLGVTCSPRVPRFADSMDFFRTLKSWVQVLRERLQAGGP